MKPIVITDAEQPFYKKGDIIAIGVYGKPQHAHCTAARQMLSDQGYYCTRMVVDVVLYGRHKDFTLDIVVPEPFLQFVGTETFLAINNIHIRSHLSQLLELYRAHLRAREREARFRKTVQTILDAARSLDSKEPLAVAVTTSIRLEDQ